MHTSVLTWNSSQMDVGDKMFFLKITPVSISQGISVAIYSLYHLEALFRRDFSESET